MGNWYDDNNEFAPWELRQTTEDVKSSLKKEKMEKEKIFKDVIERYGKNDGKDTHRFNLAAELAPLIDVNIAICFRHVISLENKGLLEFTND